MTSGGLRRPAAVVFDMDGLLLNTEGLRIRAVEDCAAELGLNADLDLFRAFIGGAGPRERAALDAHVRAELTEDFWPRYRVCLDRRMASDLAPMPGAERLLTALAAAGVPRAIATSARPESVRDYCGRLGLLESFVAVVAKGDYASPKPAPDAYLTAAARLGLAPADCWALEDSPNGARAALAAGLTTFIVPDCVAPAPDALAGGARLRASLDEVAEDFAALAR